MLNVECIVKPSILKAYLFVDAISEALAFLKSKYMFWLYNHNNRQIMSFNVQILLVPTPLVKNKHIGVSWYNWFLCITSSNIFIFFHLIVWVNYNINKIPSLLNMVILWNFHFLKIMIFGLIHSMIEWHG
jgi:hypothetical protein